MQDVGLVAGIGQRGEGFGQAHDADRGLVQQLVAAGLDDLHVRHCPILAHLHRQHQLARDPARARLAREIEVADALDPRHPRAHVGRVGVLLRVGVEELALGPLGIGLRLALDLGREPRHLHAALDQLASAGHVQRRHFERVLAALDHLFRLRGRDHRRRLPRLRLRCAGAHRRRRQAGLQFRHRARHRLARPLGLVVLAAAALGGVGQEVRIPGLLRGAGLDQDHVQRRQAGGGVLEGEAHAQDDHRVQQRREGGGDAHALAWPDARAMHGLEIGRARVHAPGRRPCACSASMRSNSSAAMLRPHCASSSRMPVGLVTLISVR